MKYQKSSSLELKRLYKDDIKKTVIAFANTIGGIIYIGISDNGDVFGIENTDEVMLQISNSVRNDVRPDVSMFCDYSVESTGGKDVIKIEVQKGTACPYYIAGKGVRPEGVFVRDGTSTVPATESAILKMIKETAGDKYECACSLLQELTFDGAKKEFSAFDVDFGKNQMRALGLIDENGIYTNLGLLLSDQCKHTIKVAVFEGNDKIVFKDRREFEGSLLKQLSDAYDFIDRYNANHGEINGLYRVDKRDYPTEAIREALLNGIVHRDYSFSGSTLISIFADKIEFVTIGGLVKGISFDDMMLGVSVTRNELLANVFYRLKLIEAYGTGVPKIMSSYSSFPQKPLIETTDNAFKITLYNINIAHSQAHDDELGEKEILVLELLTDRKSIVRKDIEKELKFSQSTTIRTLRSLTDKGFIVPKGCGKNTVYVKGGAR